MFCFSRHLSIQFLFLLYGREDVQGQKPPRTRLQEAVALTSPICTTEKDSSRATVTAYQLPSTVESQRALEFTLIISSH